MGNILTIYTRYPLKRPKHKQNPIKNNSNTHKTNAQLGLRLGASHSSLAPYTAETSTLTRRSQPTTTIVRHSYTYTIQDLKNMIVRSASVCVCWFVSDHFERGSLFFEPRNETCAERVLPDGGFLVNWRRLLRLNQRFSAACKFLFNSSYQHRKNRQQ